MKGEELHQPSYLSHQPSFEVDIGYRLPPSHLGSARASTALTLGSASVLDTGGGNCSDCNSALREVVKMINVKEGWCLASAFLFCIRYIFALSWD